MNIQKINIIFILTILFKFNTINISGFNVIPNDKGLQFSSSNPYLYSDNFNFKDYLESNITNLNCESSNYVVEFNIEIINQPNPINYNKIINLLSYGNQTNKVKFQLTKDKFIIYDNENNIIFTSNFESLLNIYDIKIIKVISNENYFNVFLNDIHVEDSIQYYNVSFLNIPNSILTLGNFPKNKVNLDDFIFYNFHIYSNFNSQLKSLVKYEFNENRGNIIYDKVNNLNLQFMEKYQNYYGRMKWIKNIISRKILFYDSLESINSFNNSNYLNSEFHSKPIEKINYGKISIGLSVNDFTWRDKVYLNINNFYNSTQNDLVNETIICTKFSRISNFEESYIVLFDCIIEINKTGTYNIYLNINSNDNWYNLNKQLIITDFSGYSDYSSNSQNSNILNNQEFVEQTRIEANNQNKSNLSEILLLAGFITGISLLIIILFVLKFYNSQNSNMKRIIAKVDLLGLQIRENDEVNNSNINNLEIINEIPLGIGYPIRRRTSVIGGLFTILVVIMCIFLTSSYLYDIISSNNQTDMFLSTSNGNSITNVKSDILISVKFNEILYGTCVSGGRYNQNITGECDLATWTLGESNLDLISQSSKRCIQTTGFTDFSINCEIIWLCENCAPVVGIDSDVKFKLDNLNVAYKSLDYSVKITSDRLESYNHIFPNEIKGRILSNQSTLFQGKNPNIISITTNPVVYDEYSRGDKYGFVLDYQNTVIGDKILLNNYGSNAESIFSYDWEYDGINNKIVYEPTQIKNNTIEVVVKISRNPTWLYITKSVRYSYLVILAQMFGMIGGVFSVSRFILNLICKPFIRKILYYLKNIKLYNYKVCFCKSDKDENVKNKNIKNSKKEQIEIDFVISPLHQNTLNV